MPPKLHVDTTVQLVCCTHNLSASLSKEGRNPQVYSSFSFSLPLKPPLESSSSLVKGCSSTQTPCPSLQLLQTKLFRRSSSEQHLFLFLNHFSDPVNQAALLTMAVAMKGQEYVESVLLHIQQYLSNSEQNNSLGHTSLCISPPSTQLNKKNKNNENNLSWWLRISTAWRKPCFCNTASLWLQIYSHGSQARDSTIFPYICSYSYPSRSYWNLHASLGLAKKQIIERN